MEIKKINYYNIIIFIKKENRYFIIYFTIICYLFFFEKFKYF